MTRWKILAAGLAGALLSVVVLASGSAQSPPVPSPQQPAQQGGVTPPPPAPQGPAQRVRRPRGARPSPVWKIIRAARYVPKIAVPPAFIPAIPKLAMWGNDRYGDCVTAEEMAKLAIYSVTCGLPEVLVSDQACEQWAAQHGVLNGADLSDVLDMMASEGISWNGTTYRAGTKASVDYTSYSTVCAAIAETSGPVKIAVAADQLENTVGNGNGWIATGYRRDGNTDHCVGLVGYGTMAQLCQSLGVPTPSNATSFPQCYLLFTWSTVGVIDHASMVAIAAEAWTRTPPTVGESPAPTPGAVTYTLGPGAPPGASVDPAGVFTWPIPASQTPGSVTVTFTATSAAGSATGSFVIMVTASSGAVVIAPIPPQAGVAGQSFTLNLGQYVSTSTGHK